jgi:hypothetical protein
LVACLNDFVTFRRAHYDPVAAALWNIHTYVYEQFSHTPRFGAFSYDPQSGKSVLVTHLFGKLARKPKKYVADKHIAASLYWIIDSERPTILLDEGQNAEIVGTLKTITNGGFEADMGGVARRQGAKGAVKEYNLFAPLAFCWNQGSANSVLALDTLSRCIVLDFDKAPRKARFDSANKDQEARFEELRERILAFVATADLNLDPDIPSQIDKGRYADCWRPLLSIADALDRGKMAREAAIAMASRRMDESARLRLLRDIRSIFYNLKVKTLTTDRLLQELLALEKCSLEDGETWSFWKGENRARNPHPLTKNEMFAMLRSFRVPNVDPLVTKTIRVAGQENPDRGYHIDQFHVYWEKFCADDGGAVYSPGTRISNMGRQQKDEVL